MTARIPFHGQGHARTLMSRDKPHSFALLHLLPFPEGCPLLSFTEQGVPGFPVLLSHLGGTDWGLTGFFLLHL